MSEERRNLLLQLIILASRSLEIDVGPDTDELQKIIDRLVETE